MAIWQNGSQAYEKSQSITDILIVTGTVFEGKVNSILCASEGITAESVEQLLSDI